MACGITLDGLFGEVAAMQDCLQRDDTAATGQLLLAHDRHLRRFLADPEADTGGAEVLGRLLAAQRAVIDLLVAARDGAGRQLQASHRNQRASRAYLANIES